MKTPLICLLTFFLGSIVIPASAQFVSDSARYEESIYSIKKRKVILDYMHLTEAEKASFWPLYENYCQTIRYIEMESLQMLNEYHNPAQNLDPIEKRKYSEKILENDLLLAKVRKQFYKKFRRALTPERASEFMELDDTLRMMTRMQVKQNAERLPVTQASLR
jgi:hypothetical protein